MANSYRNPWVIDTAATTAISANRVFIQNMVWSGYTDATHKCIIKDTARDLVVMTLDGNTDLSPINIYGEFIINKPAVTTLGSGVLTIFVQ